MSNEQLYEFQGQMYTKEIYEMILDRWGERSPEYIVSKIKEELQGKDADVPYIQRSMVLPVLEELCYDDYFSDEYIYNYIYENWSFVENGCDLKQIAEYLYDYRYGDCSDKIQKQLKKRLKKQTDKDGYITIYRGFNGRNREDGNSYTLSKEKAIWFANRFRKESYVNKYKIHIRDVLAFITDRNEAEIVALPEDVILLETNYMKSERI